MSSDTRIGQEFATQDTPRTRRTFCLDACRFASVAALGPIVQACSGGNSPTSPTGSGVFPPLLPVTNATTNGNTIMVALADTPLAMVGGAARVVSGAGQLLVTRTGADSALALTAICTHQQCTITGLENFQYVCPCHGSRFSTNGAVTRGPATQSLRGFATAIADDTLIITL